MAEPGTNAHVLDGTTRVAADDDNTQAEVPSPDDDSQSELDSNSDSDSIGPFDSIFDHLECATGSADSSLQQQPFSRLCYRCQGTVDALSQEITERTGKDNSGTINGNFFESFDALQESALAGCALCRELIQDYELSREIGFWQNVTMQDDENPTEPETNKVTVEASVDNSPSYITLWAKEANRTPGRLCSVNIFPTSSPNLIAKSNREMSNSVWKSPRTSDCLPLLETWLTSCCAMHKKCERSSEPPSRLIFVGDGQLRLQLDTSQIGCTRYATLSHCWGKTNFEVLTSRNIQNFTRQIPTSALSRTFQDAIFVARELKINWVWIDSLCIIQNDATDWEVESSKMASIYGGATLNIAASSAIDGHGGLFFDRETHWQCQIELQLGGKTAGYSCIADHAHEVLVQQSILASRAWTLQERLLPARTVFFTKNQVFWECQQGRACELFPTKSPYNMHMWHELETPRVRRLDWEHIIENYSRTKLTNPTDKLVAISGLVRAIQLQTRDEYVAGLWRSTLLCDLCWRISGVSSKIPLAPIPYRSPSWSWASLDNEVAFLIRTNHNQATRLAKILSVSITPSSGDILGAIKDATLCISSGFLIRVALNEIKKDGKSSDWRMIAGEAEKGLLSGLSDVYIDRCDQQLSHVWFVALCQWGSWIYGLVLESISDTRGRYRRVGLFSYLDKDFTRIKATFNSEVCLPQKNDCLSISSLGNGKKEYAIELV